MFTIPEDITAAGLRKMSHGISGITAVMVVLCTVVSVLDPFLRFALPIPVGILTIAAFIFVIQLRHRAALMENGLAEVKRELREVEERSRMFTIPEDITAAGLRKMSHGISGITAVMVVLCTVVSVLDPFLRFALPIPVGILTIAAFIFVIQLRHRAALMENGLAEVKRERRDPEENRLLNRKIYIPVSILLTLPLFLLPSLIGLGVAGSIIAYGLVVAILVGFAMQETRNLRENPDLKDSSMYIETTIGLIAEASLYIALFAGSIMAVFIIYNKAKGQI